MKNDRRAHKPKSHKWEAAMGWIMLVWLALLLWGVTDLKTWLFG